MEGKMRITGIITQGASRLGTPEFIKAFKVASSLDGKTYAVFRDEAQRKDKVRQKVICEGEATLKSFKCIRAWELQCLKILGLQCIPQVLNFF